LSPGFALVTLLQTQFTLNGHLGTVPLTATAARKAKEKRKKAYNDLMAASTPQERWARGQAIR
jgi:hypothetical protein